MDKVMNAFQKYFLETFEGLASCGVISFEIFLSAPEGSAFPGQVSLPSTKVISVMLMKGVPIDSKFHCE